MAKHSNKHSRKHSRKNKGKKSYKNNNRKDKTKTKKRSLRRREQRGDAYGPFSPHTQPYKGQGAPPGYVPRQGFPTGYQPGYPPQGNPYNTLAYDNTLAYNTSADTGAYNPYNPYNSNLYNTSAGTGAYGTPFSAQTQLYAGQGAQPGYTSNPSHPSSQPPKKVFRGLKIYTTSGNVVEGKFATHGPTHTPTPTPTPTPEPEPEPTPTQIVYNGTSLPDFLTSNPYLEVVREGNRVYSDHAPIKYIIDGKTIITWNIGQWGCLGPYNSGDRLISINTITPGEEFDEKKYSYNHKFNNIQLETLEQYKQRLQNIALAINEIYTANPTAIFLLQELPVVVKDSNKHQGPFPVDFLSTLLPIFYENIGMLSSLSPAQSESYESFGTVMSECVVVFNSALSRYGLKILRDNCSSSMIVRNGNLNFKDYNLVEAIKGYFVGGLYKTFPVTSLDSGINGFFDITDPSKLYISIHIRMKAYRIENSVSHVVEFSDLTKLHDILQAYKQQFIRRNSGEPDESNKIRKVYFCGDFNMPANFIKNLTTAQISLHTTPDEECFSLCNNKGAKNPKNIDLILEMDI